jgi:hypothetical protein
MTSLDFVPILNWRLILVHLIACWFFIGAFLQFSHLHDPKLIDLRYYFNDHNIKTFSQLDRNRILDGLSWSLYGELLGRLIGFLISFFISKKQNWYWVNSGLVLLVGFSLNGFDLFGWHYLKIIFLEPGSFFKYATIWYFLINGSVMLAIGLLLFFWRRAIQFINSLLTQPVSKMVRLMSRHLLSRRTEQA